MAGARAGVRPRRAPRAPAAPGQPLGRGEAALIISASEADADLLYATRFFAPDPFIFYQTGRRRTAVLSDLEIDRGRRQAEVERILSLTEVRGRMRQERARGTELGEIAAWLLAREGVRLVHVPGSFPVQYLSALRRRRLRVVVGATPFYSRRLIKSAEEVRHLAAALRIAEAGMAAGIDRLRRSRPGADGVLRLGGERLTSERLRTVIEQEILARGGLPAHTIVAGGRQACDPHDSGSGPLRAGEAIILDIFPRAARTGYFGDITRTVVRGRAGEALRRQWQAVDAGQKLALGMLKAGVDGADVHRAILHLFEQRGFATGNDGGRMQGFFHGTGHGLGLEIHEPPRISPLPRRLETGNVVTVEPGLYYPRTGGVRLEDVVVIEPDGCRNLTRFPKYLEI